MNIYIMADIEGISGIYAREQVVSGGERFSEGREFFTQEINACAEACKEAGADKVYVRDCHGGSYSLKLDKVSGKKPNVSRSMTMLSLSRILMTTLSP